MNNSVRICLVEDDEIMGEALCERLEMEGLEYQWTKLGNEAIKAISEQQFSVVLSDIRLPDISGEKLFETIRNTHVEFPPFVFMTAYGTVDQAVSLMKSGASDYFTKPLDVDNLIKKLKSLSLDINQQPASSFILGISAPIRAIESTLNKLANSNCTVLVTGESGTGKEEVAKLLHNLNTSESVQPFIPVNCSAIPETLFEAEMFGYEKGSFTGANSRHIGFFEQANNGTLFLDEIGDMPLSMQVKLLRVIQERSITRIGGSRPVDINVRFICATNENMESAVDSGRFREDLFYRINVVNLVIPPLRDRREDILWLARKFLDAQNKIHKKRNFQLSKSAQNALLSHLWPGNIRELKHCIERACILASKPTLEPNNLFQESQKSTNGGVLPEEKLHTYIEICEKHYIEQMLFGNQWHMTNTAECLGISRKNLWQKMRKYNIQRDEEHPEE